MASGYSGTPLARKLGIKSGHRVGLVNAPDGFESMLDGLPESVELSRAEKSSMVAPDVMVVFVKSIDKLTDSVMSLAPRMPADGALWIAWPKKSSGIVTDMTEERVRDVALPTGLVDNKVCAIDETWSGLRLVVRKEHRHGWPGNFPVNS